MNGPISTPALDAMRRSIVDAVKVRTVAQALSLNALKAHYQPIVELKTGTVMGHESLIRGPIDSPLQFPDALFAAARAEGLVVRLEQACLIEGLRTWVHQAQDKRLFVNLSAQTLVTMVDRISIAGVMRTLKEMAVSPSALVIEITEHENVADLPKLIGVASELRALGLRFALDDFGDGRSSLRLWAELRPEIVKIDKYFTRDLSRHAEKLQTLRALLQISQTLGYRGAS